MQRAYLEYLETPEWWAKRKRLLARANYRCERCGGCGPLEAHHRIYDRLGWELLEDLELLCPTCHANDRLPKNLEKAGLEAEGQGRMFDRWNDPAA
jgi:5-methylcytosine-specific restriction endonuclease McrA